MQDSATSAHSFASDLIPVRLRHSLGRCLSLIVADVDVGCVSWRAVQAPAVPTRPLNTRSHARSCVVNLAEHSLLSQHISPLSRARPRSRVSIMLSLLLASVTFLSAALGQPTPLTPPNGQVGTACEILWTPDATGKWTQVKAVHACCVMWALTPILGWTDQH